MGNQALIPPPTVLYATDMFWPPQRRTIASAAAWEVQADTRFAISGTPVSLWAAGDAPPLASMDQQHEMMVGRLEQGSSRAMDGFPISFPLGAGTWPSAFRLPEPFRLFRLQFCLATSGAFAPTNETGLEFVVSAGTVAPFPTLAAGTGMFGIAGDGVSWSYVKKRAAAQYVGVSLDAFLSAPLTEFTLFDFEIRAASGAGAASLRLFVNGALALSDSWAAGTTLPNYTHGALANSNKFVPVVRGKGGVGNGLQLTGVRCLAGKYTVEGQELL